MAGGDVVARNILGDGKAGDGLVGRGARLVGL
jgi:hypothetical protein